MIKRRRFALCVLLLALAPLVSAPLAFAETPADSGSGTSAATDATGTDPGASAPITLSPDQIQAMQDAADGQTNDRSVFEKAADFVTDNAPFFIIGIIVVAAIAAGILILRGRGGPAGAPAGATAAERRRRKRVETQRVRQEERLRRQASRRGGPAAARPRAAAGAPDPDRSAIEAEKLGADQERAAAAVARARGPVAAPYSPSQTAPTPGVVTDPAAGAPVAVGGAASSYRPGTREEEPTAAIGLPAGGDPVYESSLESPGADATVGRNAAAFAASAGAVAGRGPAPSSGEQSEVLPPAGPPEIPPAADELAGAPGPVYDERLRSTLEHLRDARSGFPGPEERGAGLAEPPAGPRGEPEAESGDTGLSLGLAAVERRLSAEREQRDRALQEAEDRLRRVEQRAEDAERRAAFAERLTQLKLEESERDERLRSVMSGIERAERRATDAEDRARAAELSAAAALEGRSAGEDPEAEATGPEPPSAEPEPDRPEQLPEETPAKREREAPTGIGSPRGDRGRQPASPPEGGDQVNLNRATFEQLRGLGLSVTQATRILAYRERFGGYDSLDDLDRVPGFTADRIESMRTRFTV